MEWQLPHSQDLLFSHSTIEPTPVSRYLTVSGVVGSHSHEWLFAHGGGNGVRCALGNGDSIRFSVWSREVARFLEEAQKHGDKDEVAMLLRYTFARDLSRVVLHMASLAPTDGFPNKEAYRSWMSDQAWLLENEIRIAPSEKRDSQQ